MSMQMTFIICTNIYLQMGTVNTVKVICTSTYETLYVNADDLYHLHYHILTHVDCAYGLSHMHKYIWNIVCLCRWLISYALTYTYKCRLCIWFKSSAQVHMKHCMFMQMTYTICTNIYLYMLTVHLYLQMVTVHLV